MSTDLRVNRLLSYARELQRASSFEDLVVTTRAEIEGALGYVHAWLFIAHRDGSEWRLVATAGPKRDALKEHVVNLRVDTSPLIREITNSATPVVIIDARTDPRPNKESAAKLNSRTIIHVPLRLDGDVAPHDQQDLVSFGALGTGTFGDQEGVRAPTPAEVDYLTAMASQLSVAADRVRRLEERVALRTAEIEKANQDLQTLRGALESLVEVRTRALRNVNEALLESETRFRRLVDSGIVGIVLSDVAGRMHDANDAFLSIVGYTRADLLEGKVSGASLNTPERETTDAAARLELMTRGSARPWEKELLRKDGSRVPILIGVAMLDSGDTTGESIAFVVDLTEKKRAEEATSESEARKTAVMEAAIDAIVITDHNNEIVDVNRAVETLFGYSRNEVVGRRFFEVVSAPVFRAELEMRLKRYLDTDDHELNRRVEVTLHRKDGADFPAELTLVRIRSKGTPVFTWYVRDITERKKAAEAELLRREKEAVEAANAELEAFSYSVAHDLRTPLRAIGGFSSILLDDYGDKLDDSAKTLIHRVTAGTTQMGQIIDALLELARLSRSEPRLEPVNLSEIANQILSQLQAAEPERSVEIVIADNLHAQGDPLLLRAVLANLIGNAWKFTRKQPNPRIEVGCTTPLSGLLGGPVFYVRDNGAGFDMKYVDKLFIPFQRLHSSKEFEGTGVGLATVERIVRRHGGKVWAEGVADGGAMIEFTLPSRDGKERALIAPKPTG